jgi:hypothetical protein
MIGWALLARAGKGLLAILAVGITIPFGLLLAAGIWLWLDRSSAIRQTVDRAVAELVDGAELEAARAREEALNKIIADQRQKSERDRAALARFAELLAAAQTEKEGLADELAELEATPLPDRCTVDRALLNRLRR